MVFILNIKSMTYIILRPAHKPTVKVNPSHLYPILLCTVPGYSTYQYYIDIFVFPFK